MQASDLPDLLKHMALVIYAKGYVRGTKIEQLAESLTIARRQLAHWGYLTAGSAKGPLSNIMLTGKGRARTMKHKREKGGAFKTAQFDALYAPILAADEVLGTQETETASAGLPVAAQIAQKQQTVARAALHKPPASVANPHAKKLKRPKVKHAKIPKAKSARRR